MGESVFESPAHRWKNQQIKRGETRLAYTLSWGEALTHRHLGSSFGTRST
uniref:Uncharacterized protein n=1 Tax=Anguilla anguilla TaxID=7936 RepID=A0A0E9XE46_ANGAN